MTESIDTSNLRCTCPSCVAGATHHENGIEGVVLDASLDPNAGGTYADKPIYDLTQITENLNRTGYDWYTNNYGELDDGVLNFGFWLNRKELANSYYTNATGTLNFSQYDTFVAFNEDQKDLARDSIQLWDDLIAIGVRETKSGAADITFGNTDEPGVQAYAYLPFGDVYDEAYSAIYDFDETGRLGGDVWIGNQAASNFFPIADSYYSKITMVHEIGHSFGLSHPGDYNAGDDDDGDGVPDPITYANDAFFAQDSRQYTVMSYFDAYETGAQHVDFSLLNFAYAATPLVHDIATIQDMYGADFTTRAGDTVYGFNSTADRSAFDFTVNTRPIVAIWDGGGKDTLDFSGWNTPSIIDLNAGAFSSGGGIEDFLTLEQVNANRAELGFAPRTQAAFDFYESLKAQFGLTNGLFTDNISIAYGATIENAIGGGGADRIIANQVANIIDGGDGRDFVSYETATKGVSVSLETGLGARGAKGDELTSVEGLFGSAFKDFLTGDAGNNRLQGGDGSDRLTGGAGNDTFSFRPDAESGTDRITDFAAGDKIVTNQAILDADGDGIVALDSYGALILDAAGSDRVVLVGYEAGTSIAFLGQVGTQFFYGLPGDAPGAGGIADEADALFAVPEAALEFRDGKGLTNAVAFEGPAANDSAVHFAHGLLDSSLGAHMSMSAFNTLAHIGVLV